MKLLGYNKSAITIPSEVGLNIDFHSSNLLEICTSENTIEHGFCLQFENNEPRPLNIALYREHIGEWFVDPQKIDRIVANSTNLQVYFKNGESNVCDYLRFC